LSATGDRRLVIAHSVELVQTGERAFVQQLADPGPDRLTYSSLMNAQECAAIDLGAYRDARSWYLSAGSDTSIVDSVSLGRAFEYCATESLIRHRRAALVLEKLLASSADKTVRLRGVGDEWSTMARALGAEPIVEDPGVSPSATTRAYLPPRSRSRRLLARLAGAVPPKKPWLVLVGSPAWTRPYHHLLLRGASVELVDPSRRLLLYAIGRRARSTSIWLGDLERAGRAPVPSDSTVTSPERAPIRAVEAQFQLFQPSLSSWAAAGRRAGGPGVVAIAAQDVLPPERAFLLGVRAAGGRVITLEHGMAGGYTEQVSSVADALAAWGEPQAAYHRSAGPSGIRVVAVGWPRLESRAALAPPAGDDAWDLLHFSQPSDDLSAGDWSDAHLRAVQLVEEYARLNPHRRVAIKLHPASRAYGFTPAPIRHAHLVTGDSLDLIASSRIVVVVASTTGIEAMSMGRPVLQVPPRGNTGPIDFISASGAARRVDTVAEIADATDHLLSDGAAYRNAAERGRAYARSFIEGFGQPGGAVQRLADLVAELRHP
jgi:hypothetical protein